MAASDLSGRPPFLPFAALAADFFGVLMLPTYARARLNSSRLTSGFERTGTPTKAAFVCSDSPVSVSFSIVKTLYNLSGRFVKISQNFFQKPIGRV